MLEAVQLTILVDKDAPENVLESYTFSFRYTGVDNDVNNRLESLSIEPMGCVADMKTAQTARIGLETIVRRLITLSAFLPTLPSMYLCTVPCTAAHFISRQEKPRGSPFLYGGLPS